MLKGTRVATPNPADAVAMAVTKFGERLYENKLTATLDAVRIYADLVHEVAGTTLAEFARMVNEVAGKEVARVGKNKKKHFVELSYEDFIELVRAVEGAP